MNTSAPLLQLSVPAVAFQVREGNVVQAADFAGALSYTVGTGKIFFTLPRSFLDVDFDGWLICWPGGRVTSFTESDFTAFYPPSPIFSPADYTAFVASRTKELGSPVLNALHAAVGISGEAGELLDAVKKVWIYGKPMDNVNICEELGDLLFYIQMMATLQGTTIERLMQDNCCKLEKRYPAGYSDAAAQARADKAGETNHG